MGMNNETKLRKFQAARWDEQLIFEQSVPGERGILVPAAEPELQSLPGTAVLGGLKRKKAPGLPEINQMKVNRHYMRLSQEASCAVDLTLNISEGTCTMKYSPKIQEHMSRLPMINDVHPLQHPDTMQGILEIYYRTEQCFKAISGLDAFSFQPGGGSQAIYLAGSIMRAYQRDQGRTEKDEVVTTSFSHPVDSATPAANGFKVITLMPDAEGYPDLAALKAAVNEHTAGLFITNPEDTGLFNKRIKEYVQVIRDAKGLCFYDQANANGMLGITRAREAGFDMCHFNLHKSFSAPHGSYGPASGAVGVREFLRSYLPVPHVGFDGDKYTLEYNVPRSIGMVRSFLGNTAVVLKAYMWIMQLGPEGLKAAAIGAVLNNNYMEALLRKTRGLSIKYGSDKRRLEQIRYSWDILKEETGIGTDEINYRVQDFGIPDYWTAHPPYLIPEPMTLEPADSYNKDDIDEYVAVLQEAAREAYEEPELYKRLPPFHAVCHRPQWPMVEKAEDNACTWRLYNKNMAHRMVRK
jgi:glycine dehydrogenase subunit 2